MLLQLQLCSAAPVQIVNVASVAVVNVAAVAVVNNAAIVLMTDQLPIYSSWFHERKFELEYPLKPLPPPPPRHGSWDQVSYGSPGYVLL